MHRDIQIVKNLRIAIALQLSLPEWTKGLNGQ